MRSFYSIRVSEIMSPSKVFPVPVSGSMSLNQRPLKYTPSHPSGSTPNQPYSSR